MTGLKVSCFRFTMMLIDMTETFHLDLLENLQYLPTVHINVWIVIQDVTGRRYLCHTY